MKIAKFKVSDPVSFRFKNSVQAGFIASIHRDKAVVIVHGKEFHAPMSLLQFRNGVSPKRVFTKNRLKRLEFCVGDDVYFLQNDQDKKFGTLEIMNPKRGRVRCRDAMWNVPYEHLYSVRRNDRGEKNLQRLTSIADLADKLLAAHGLDEWRFIFDDATKRGGLCSSANKMISMSEQFCLKVDDAEVEDTILHEIAHALVGVEHGHDAIWRAKALEIGCSGERTHNSSFTTPKYIVSCVQCGWQQARQKRLRNLICRYCSKPVQYQPYRESSEAR